MYKDEEINIRTMVDADLFFLKQILMDPVVLNFFPMSNFKEVEDSIKVWKSYARKNSAYTIDVNNRPVGMATIYVNSFEKLKYQSLFAIVIDKEYRGKGLGSKLLKYIMEEAFETFGITLLHLEVYEGNPAYNLYYRCGFREYGRHDFFLKDTDGTYHSKILMQIKLG